MSKPKKRAPKRGPGSSDLEALEFLLQSSLHPVEPRPDFRSGLHTRLARTPVPPRSPGTILQYVIISLGSVAAVALMVIAGARAMSALLNSLGLLRQMSAPKEPAQQAAPMAPVP